MIREKHIISLISSYVSKHAESEDMYPRGHKKGDSDHIEAQNCYTENIGGTSGASGGGAPVKSTFGSDAGDSNVTGGGLMRESFGGSMADTAAFYEGAATDEKVAEKDPISHSARRKNLESIVIDIISTFLDKPEEVERFKCGHKKGDPNHLEAQADCGGEPPKVDSDSLGVLPDSGSAFDVGYTNPGMGTTAVGQAGYSRADQIAGTGGGAGYDSIKETPHAAWWD